MKSRHLLLGAGVVASAWLAFFGDRNTSSDIAEPVVPRPVSTTSVSRINTGTGNSDMRTSAQGAATILALLPRETLIGGARLDVPAEGIFNSQNWTPPPPPPPKPPPPPPPSAPPVPFTFLGKKVESGIWEVYLARGDQTYIVQEKSVIEGMYRVDAIKPPVLTITYLPLVQVQTITIGGSD